MNKFAAYLFTGAMALSLAGCSAAPSRPVIETENENESEPAAVDSFEGGQEVLKAFEDAGYYTFDENYSENKLTFHAMDKLGTLEVTITKGNALAEYQALNDSYSNENQFAENSTAKADVQELTFFNNAMNDLDNAAALNLDQDLCISVTGIPTGDVDSVKAVFESLGYDA